MCGIAGVLLKPGAAVSEALLRAMADKQRHRGPDQRGFFSRGNLGLAHNRLSILDLSETGRQPFVSENYALVYNGEIYNHLELRRDLEHRGITCRGGSDTVALFESLALFGVEATLRRIKGMFAFAFCDLRDKTVYLCRDRVGIKPLAWTLRESGLYWASEVKALAAAAAVEPDPTQALLALGGMAEASGRETVFKDVHNVEPGTYLVCRAGAAPEVRRYYSAASEVDEGRYRELERMPEREAAATFSRALEASVKAMLMSDVPVGAFVSGGVDSGLIAGLAARHDPRISLFTANVLGAHSEYEDAKALSASLGRPLHEAPFSPEMMLSQWAEATYHYECPIVTHTNAIPFGMVARLARGKGVKPVLTGEGSDELFLGYARPVLEHRMKWLRLPVRLLEKIYGVSPRLRELVLPGPGGTADDFAVGLARRFEHERRPQRALEAFPFLAPRQARLQYEALHLLGGHLRSLLHRNDRMGMWASVESRFPFLDEAVIGLAVNLPAKLKLSGTWRLHDWRHPFLLDKAVVRCAAAGVIPRALALKSKNGFPMYGHRSVRVRPGCFTQGYVAGLLRLSSAEIEEACARNAYFAAKLLSVEVFGRIFSLHESAEQVTRRLLAHASMDC
ncbi:MAG: asparagine synthase (glutamine-hydrolyzing) [Elusimicrobia bacterium]|nr:asparagine synthase (glutamine-hydrolyzing) [Elusimicrobiota bacterium]